MTVPIAREQVAIVEAIERGAASGEGGRLKRVDTHMSHLFLGREKVFKLKRSLRHPFSDQSTIAARRTACEAELAVNRALAPDLYEGVLPVNAGPGGALAIGGPGEAVDWVVVMRRFADGALLSEIADAGQLTPALVSEAVEVIADFHRRLEPHTDAGHVADIRRVIAGLRRTEADGAADLGTLAGSDDLFAALDREAVRLAPLIEARRRAGWVRRGHGDLHLRNLCVFEGRVTPFDALEFDAALATTDVLYDFAFLLMDLRVRGLDGHANAAMNRYWDSLGMPEDSLALLPLFMALRATVRMAVGVEAGELVEAGRYRMLARSLLAPVRPRLIAIGGLSGTGKSTLAAALSPWLAGACGARLLRSDVLRKQQARTRTLDHLAEDAYGPAARASVYDLLCRRVAEAVGADAEVIADATFQEERARTAIEAAATGRAFTGFWLEAPATVRAARVDARRGDASDATVAVALAQVEPEQLGPAWIRLDAARGIEAMVREALERMGQPGRGPPLASP
jgi:uncharacterized protein